MSIVSTMQRPEPLDRFIDATRNAVLGVAAGDAGAAGQRIFSALGQSTGDIVNGDGATLDTCRYLGGALDDARNGPSSIAALANAFDELTPMLSWKRRVGAEEHGPKFFNNHANTWIVGPDSLEQRKDVVIGASLVAPQTNYPEHNHPPEELYIVMSEGEWFSENNDWHSPGPGGIVYNEPGIGHAMRSGETPLLAVWCLWVGS